MPSLFGARRRHTQPVCALPVFLCSINESPGPPIPRRSVTLTARAPRRRNRSWPPQSRLPIERGPVLMGTAILRFTPPRHPLLELHDTCPGGFARVRSPGPFRSLQRHREANLGVMQRESIPPAGFPFAGLCIAYHKLVALVRNRPLG